MKLGSDESNPAAVCLELEGLYERTAMKCAVSRALVKHRRSNLEVPPYMESLIKDMAVSGPKERSIFHTFHLDESATEIGKMIAKEAEIQRPLVEADKGSFPQMELGRTAIEMSETFKSFSRVLHNIEDEVVEKATGELDQGYAALCRDFLGNASGDNPAA
ncbi:MAG: hypothetical protein JWS12_917 [Candidatus Saccharibacteria bacterium]|nr:hypothetical protein [Candidatus Saccharibacteria bacterium]